MKVVSLSSSFVVEAAAAGKAWNRGNGFGGEAFKSLRWVAKKQWFPAPQAHHCDSSSLVRGVQKPPNKNHREWWWWRCFLLCELHYYYSGFLPNSTSIQHLSSINILPLSIMVPIKLTKKGFLANIFSFTFNHFSGIIHCKYDWFYVKLMCVTPSIKRKQMYVFFGVRPKVWYT